MDKIQLAKAIINNMTAYSVGAAVGVFLSNNRKHSDNKALELSIDLSTLVTSWVVTGVVHDALIPWTDAHVDEIVNWYRTKIKK